jgi:frataxin
MGRRLFQTEGEYHKVADETLETIQDALDEVFESNPQPQEIEISYASGVLTISLPPHGTWVLNKQTPNQQIWWSSPLSGPRRYEYEDGKWTFTRTGASETLGKSLKDEILELYQLQLDLRQVE